MSRISANGIFSSPVNAAARQGVKQKIRASGRGSLFAAINIIIVILLFTLFYLWSRLAVISLGYEIAKADQERAALMADNKKLKLEILSLKSPQRIEAIAMSKLGLVYPKGEQVIVVK
ncbi:MAG: cell division protein FtsL [Deltaproteobacteria bacterium]|nr:cell division protein FtsL [Deltaproteobacteria bacterium]